MSETNPLALKALAGEFTFIVRHEFNNIKGKTLEWTDGGGFGNFQTGGKTRSNQGAGKQVMEEDTVTVRGMNVAFF